MLYKILKIKIQIQWKTSQVYLLSGLCPSPIIQIIQLCRKQAISVLAWEETYSESDTENLGFVVPCIFNHSNKTPNKMQQSVVKFYCFVVQTLLNMFRALLCPSSGARQTALAASGFRMNVEVEVFSAEVGLLLTVCY